MDAAAPNFVVEIPAILFAKFKASLISKLFAKPIVRAPLNASPAPVVSRTGSFNLKASKKKFCSLLAK